MTRGVGGQSPSNITRHLRGLDFPASKQDLLDRARSDNAEPEVLELLERMPDQEYQSMADVMKGFGQANDEDDDDQ